MRVSVYAYYKFTRHIKDGDACSCVGSLLRFIYSVQETRISETTKVAFAGTAMTNEMEEAFGNATVPRSVRRSFDSLLHRRAYSNIGIVVSGTLHDIVCMLIYHAL